LDLRGLLSDPISVFVRVLQEVLIRLLSVVALYPHSVHRGVVCCSVALYSSFVAVDPTVLLAHQPVHPVSSRLLKRIVFGLILPIIDVAALKLH